MKLHELKPPKGARKASKRIGRGEGSKKGGTAGRGHKGAQSRSGYRSQPGFEGGQMPIQRRVPKFGFKNPNRIEYKVVNLSQLQTIADKHGLTEVDHEVLVANGIISKTGYRVKVLGKGELRAKLHVKADAFSKTARQAIEQAGGSVESLNEAREVRRAANAEEKAARKAAAAESRGEAPAADASVTPHAQSSSPASTGEAPNQD